MISVLSASDFFLKRSYDMPYTPSTDWKTTKGNLAPDAHWSGTDDAAAAHAQLKAEVESKYAGAIVIGSATRNFNCHAFVHASSHAWFEDIAAFLRDDYFQFTPGNLLVGDAVVYVKDNQITHSGVISQLSGNSITKVRSKWGAYPLVEHPPTSVPSIYGAIVYYLRKRTAGSPGITDMSINLNSLDSADLVSAMLNGERLKDLWLASTSEVAETIVKSWPEFLIMRIRGGISREIFEEKRALVSSDGLFVLSVLARNSGEPELKALGARMLVD
jgi:hypothetical protein